MPTDSRIRIVSLCPLLAMLLAGAGSIPLAGQATTATIPGTVTDSSGAAVPGAMVGVTNTGTGIVQTTLSDERGRYRVPSLNIGQYDAKAELQGFQTVIHKGIEVTIGSDVVIDFALRRRWAWMRLENSNSSPIRTARNMATCAVREKLILYLSEPWISYLSVG